MLKLFMPTDLASSSSDEGRPLSVTLVCTQAGWHGGEQQLALLLEGLRKRGHRCRVLCSQGSAFARYAAANNIELACFSGRGRLPHALWQIRRVLQDQRPDVLYYNDPHALTAAGLASLGLQIPLRVAARRVDFRLNNVARYRYLADLVICVSQAVEQICQQSGLSSQQLAVVHDGVDPRRMQHGDRMRGRLALGVSPQAPVLLTVARLADHKGHAHLMRALPALVRACPDLVWAIAGDGERRSALTELARELQVESAVRFLGHRSDVPDLIAAADLMVVPSQMEGLCSSIVDAMLVGLPVVATTAGGIPDLLDQRQDHPHVVGWLAEPRSPAALTRTILSALRFPNLTRQQAILARERAWREFTADRMVERTLELWQQRMAAGQPTPQASERSLRRVA